MCAVTVCLFILVLSASCLIPPSFSRSIASRRFCDAGQFLDIERDSCRNCTTICPQNQIIRRTCSIVTDSVCGPFFEFRPQNEEAEKNLQYKKRLQQVQKGSDGTLTISATDAEKSNPFASLPPPSPAVDERDVDQMNCWTSVGCLGILVSASLLCVVIVGLVVLIYRWRFLRDRKWLFGAVPGAGGGGRLRTHYHVIFPHVVSSSLSGSVDKRVMHLELQLRRNWQRRADAGGATSGSLQLIDGNDYVNEKMRNASMWNAANMVI